MFLTEEHFEKLNKDIAEFPQVFPIEEGMNKSLNGVSRLVMLDRYSFKDIEKKTLSEGDLVVLTVKEDPKFPARGCGTVLQINKDKGSAKILVEEEFRGVLEGHEAKTGIVSQSLDSIEKPLELFYEQITKRNAKGLSELEEENISSEIEQAFYAELKEMNVIPAGRVLYGAGSKTDVTYFNCYVMSYPNDSRGGIAQHREKVMEIMSRGGGVGTNGSTLRPKNTIARGVNGKSSGSVSWLNDIANLTNLVEQGGSRRGAQMIMMADWHPDILEFIISKMQRPDILRLIIQETNNEDIKQLAKNKLKFTPLTENEQKMHELVVMHSQDNNITRESKQKLQDGGIYSVNQPDFLTGANISICLTHDFMNAIEQDLDYELKFPDVESYSTEEMSIYNNEWDQIGDVREWEDMGMKTKVYRTIKAKDLWNLINLCATYSAEPGIFFIDNANEMTNASAYGQKVVATNPCGKVA